ncbi:MULTISPECIES: hypothetical protein [unclassified Duganella]|uniref:hypothetical protein n=1 Tax=unclassified Duganella TaxID=2636909 RepID=UPI0006FE3D45|nr:MULTISPECIES: hypothetical protein [unclassified Duganella]KQV61814.1 hypothetical protein ASD07_02995 [Duganella sp. Root336D2]KRB84319.1 hypothetical protein ASE26_09665 [Duganella sp. Root198D2]
MKLIIAIFSLVFSQASLAAANTLPAADEAAAFKAAGFKQHGKAWKSCADSGASYVPGAIEQVKDLNGDGQPEAIITESGTACYGDTGVGYALVSRQSDGKWKLITHGAGILTVLHTRGKDGWPDIEIGGPGFCFPIERWNGSAYRQHQLQYDGKPCKR